MRLHIRKLPKGPLPPKPKLPAGRAPGEPEKKAERLRRLVAAQQWHGALKLAASFRALPEPDRTTIQRAWQAVDNPAFTRGIWGEPEALVEAGKQALRRRWGEKA